MLFGSKLKRALKKALADPARLPELVESVSKEGVKTAGEAELCVRCLELFPLDAALGAERIVGSPLHDVVAWMQGVEDKKVAQVFKNFGGPELLRIFDAYLATAPAKEDEFRVKHDLMFLLKIACIYVPQAGVERLCVAARSALLKDGYLWSVIFNIVAQDGHPWQAELIDALRSPLPDGFAGVAYLDLANALSLQGNLASHPFDCGEGSERLCAWLGDPDEAHFSYAHSAAASIPFLSPELRQKLQGLAEVHPSREVQLEAAWAAAKCGDDHGLGKLQQACADPRDASRAMRYLEELGASHRIPIHTRSANFKAMAEMCEWLAHPQEFGRPPHAIQQSDTRVLYWPPTDDERQVWLFRYEYPARDGDKEPDIGYGMVGSVTFALFGESTADRSIQDVYGLHCAWELEMNEDGRAPAERTAAAGRAILAQHNSGFDEP